MMIIRTLIMLCVMLALPALANAQQLAGTHGNWRVLSVDKGGQKTCYLASIPSKSEGTFKKRSDPYLLVTHKTGVLDEVSVSAGYPFDEKQDVVIRFGQKRYSLFAKGELAWAYDEAADKAIVKEMVRGNELVVEGHSWKGTHSKDTYSLRGFTAAHRQMKGLCR